MNKYKAIENKTRKKALEELSSGDGFKKAEALLSLVFNDDDFDWVFKLCLKYLDSEDIKMKETAVLCIGHLARIHRKIDKEIIIPKIKLMAEKFPELSDRVEFTLEDIDIFVP